MSNQPFVPKIQPAQLHDLPAITEIYNDAVVNLTATFDTIPKTMEQQLVWFHKHGAQFPVRVGMIADQVVGWTSLNEYSDRPAYSETAEISIYLHPDWRGKGIGRILMDDLLNEAKRLHYHVLLARISDANDASIQLHERVGFKEVGIMREVGRKFGRRIDVAIYQITFA